MVGMGSWDIMKVEDTLVEGVELKFVHMKLYH